MISLRHASPRARLAATMRTATMRAATATIRAAPLLVMALLVGCEAPRSAASAAIDVAVVGETFETPRHSTDNVDSPAVWHGPDDQHWVLATAKAGNVIRVSDARTGAHLGRVGGRGDRAGQMRHPNGIAVIEDVMIVVERDNARVQVFALPGFEPLGTFGEERLKRPYGVAVYAEAPGSYIAYITDAGERGGDAAARVGARYAAPVGGIANSVQRGGSLADRVHHFRFSVNEDSLAVEHIRSFGDTSGPGVLHVVESIAVDAEHDRLLIAEEEEDDSKIMVYTLDGVFTGKIIGEEYFPNEAEGIGLYACGDGSGYWVATDQGKERNTFHVFDRRTLEHHGSFRGRTVVNTDGIALTQLSYEGFPEGAFFAVHDDLSTVAFSWADIAEGLGLRGECPSPERAAEGRSADPGGAF